MTKNVIVVPAEATIVEAAKLMKKHDIGSVIVVESMEKKHATGIITERDIVHKLVSQGKDTVSAHVGEAMSHPLRVVKPTTSVEEAAKAMRKNGIKRLPVVNEHNELVGVISEGDIMRIFPAIVDLIEERAALR